MVNVIFVITIFIIILECLGESLERPIFCFEGRDANQSQTNEGGRKTVNESAHNKTRTRNTNSIGLWSEILYSGTLYFSILTVMSVLLRRNNALNSPSSNHHLPQHLLGWAASLLEHDQGVLTCFSSPVLCGWRLKVPPEDWQEERLRLGPSDADAHKGKRLICEATIVELSI